MHAAIWGEQRAPSPFDRILGASRRTRELVADLERLAPASLPLLIEGEMGTGKELIAECMHRVGQRADQPFIVVDCRALTPASGEKELFGCFEERSDAVPSSSPGAFELAHRGTLFL